ncbi:MAG: hypothetical protein IJN15_02960 [Clostridia bacterium]|nr:hypothetical protein [Clostridia bacterium]
MKKFIKKHLSVILSLAIILGTVLPVISGFTGVSALSPEEQTMVDNIKTAWSNLSLTETDYNILPNRWWNVSGSVASANMADSSTYAETLPEGVDLGSKYATFTSLGDVAATESKQCILYEFKNDTAGSFAGQDRTTYNIDTIANVYFWIKIDNMTKDANLRISVRGHSGGLYLIPETITIPATKSGQWVKVSLRDETSGNWCGTITGQPFYRVMVALNNVSGSTVTAGSGTLEKKISMPSDSETANWTLIDWIKAALKVDLSAYGNTEGFVTSLNTAKSAFGEQYAIANLIKEWEALAVYHDPDINPNRWWNTSGSVSDAGMAEASTYTGTLPANVDLGANFATFTGLGNTAGISSRQCVLYEFCKDGSGSSTITAGAKSSDKINEMDDIYFWFKADNMASDITINIQVMTNDTTAKTNNLPAFVIPSSKSGQWVKVSLKEIGGSEWYGVLNEKLYRAMVAISNASGATVTVGSGKIVIPGACPVPANVENNATAWIDAAKTVDTSVCIDATAFNNALNALKAYGTEDPNVTILKEEWAKLQYVGTPDTDGYKVGIWQNGGTTYKEGNSGATKINYDANVDVAYGENQLTITGVTASGLGDAQGSAYYRHASNDPKSSKSFDQMGDLYFWYKASGNAKARIAVLGMGSSSCQTLKTTDNVVLTGDGNWHKVSVKDTMGETAWETFISNYGTYYLQRLWVNIADLDTGLTSIDVTFGSLNYTGKDTSLEGSASWSNEQWVDNALDLDLSKYKDTTAFEDAMYAALESVYGTTKADLAAQELIDAWGKLSLPEHNNILPNRWWNVSGSVASANMADSTTYTGVLPEGVDLGAKYAVFTGLGDVAATESKQCILYEFKDGSTGTIDGRDRITEYDISDIVDVSFWLKIDNMTKDANLRI